MNNDIKEPTPELETDYETDDPISLTRNGKIAALDRDIRESINRRMRKGHSNSDILAWLNANPAVQAVLNQDFEGKPLTRQNLWEWRQGGYKEWLRHRSVYARREKVKEAAADGDNSNPRGNEMAEHFAEDFMATLDELVATAPNAKARMKCLVKGLREIRGWRRSDYQADSMALTKEKWQRRCEQEVEQAEREEYETECKYECARLLRQYERRGVAPDFVDLLMVSSRDLEQLRLVQQRLDRRDEALRKDPQFDPNAPARPPQNHPTSHYPATYWKQVSTPLGKEASKSNLQHPGTEAANIQHPMSDEDAEEVGEKPSPAEAKPVNAQGAASATEFSPTLNNEKGLPNGAPSEVEPSKLSHSVKPNSSENKSDDQAKEFKPGQLTPEEAERVIKESIAELTHKAGSVGLTAPGVQCYEWAALRAYITGKPAPWYDQRIQEIVMLSPPYVDPRRDPKLRWYAITEKWERYKARGKFKG